MKGAGKPMEILTRINKMAGFGSDEDIELYEVGNPGFGSYVLDASAFKINLYLPHLTHFFHAQEIKFEPNVMCENIDKKLTFRTTQV